MNEQPVRVDEPGFELSPKVTFDQLPFTGLPSLEVNTALVAFNVPFMVSPVPELNLSSTPDCTVRVTPLFTLRDEVTMYGLLARVNVESVAITPPMFVEYAEHGANTAIRITVCKKSFLICLKFMPKK